MFRIKCTQEICFREIDSKGNNIMGKAPLFSVIIPVYMVEEYLEECVNSVLCQDFSDFEIILIEDGSPDNCDKLCDELARRDSRIKVIHKENEGVSLARKDGVSAALGEYIVCVDSDDYLSEGLFSKAAEVIRRCQPQIIMYGMIEENRSSQAKETHFRYREGFYSKTQIEQEIFPSLVHTEKAEYFPPAVCGKIIERELLRGYIFAEKKAPIGEDGACAIPCVFHASSLYILDECYYNYRFNGGSATKGRKVINWESPIIVNAHIASRIDLERQDFKQQMDRKIVHDFFNAAVSRFYGGNSYGEVRKDIIDHIKRDEIQRAMKNSGFKGSWKATLMILSLRFRWIFLLFAYAKLRG